FVDFAAASDEPESRGTPQRSALHEPKVTGARAHGPPIAELSRLQYASTSSPRALPTSMPPHWATWRPANPMATAGAAVPTKSCTPTRTYRVPSDRLALASTNGSDVHPSPPALTKGATAS